MLVQNSAARSAQRSSSSCCAAFSLPLPAFALVPAATIAAQTAQTAPPKTWVDKDTGHRVWRLSDEPNSGGFYFNVNGYTPDHKTMIYTAPDGIHVHGHGRR